jgi:hypothetical protein
MDTGPDRATGDVELDPSSGFELLPQPLIPRASDQDRLYRFHRGLSEEKGTILSKAPAYLSVRITPMDHVRKCDEDLTRLGGLCHEAM